MLLKSKDWNHSQLQVPVLGMADGQKATKDLNLIQGNYGRHVYGSSICCKQKQGKTNGLTITIIIIIIIRILELPRNIILQQPVYNLFPWERSSSIGLQNTPASHRSLRQGKPCEPTEPVCYHTVPVSKHDFPDVLFVIPSQGICF